MMQGMTLNQFSKIVEFIQEHHRFGRMPRSKRILTTDTGLRHHHDIRYIDSTYDTMGSEIWAVKLRGPGFNYRFATNEKMPDDFKYTNLNDWIMAFLNGQWKPSEDMKKIIAEKI